MNLPDPTPRYRVPRWAYLLRRTVAWLAILGGVGWLGMLLSMFLLWFFVWPIPNEYNPAGAIAMIAGFTWPVAAVAVAVGLKADRLARRYLRP